PVLIFKKLSSDICIVIPLSSKNKTGTWFCDCDLQGIRRTALLYQIKMVHKNRFQRKIGELDELDFETIKKKLGKLLNF
ncbi:MAG: type II toxin-antitoxin system PemK/MazF family toxin, partial [Candidatus Gracilibacteria bacterium]|nr:type II toxin-antitoxin system PemK/MazF family toxin [Candidatus Gracilibacteria bacterium]